MDRKQTLNVSEQYYSLQGEGVNTGKPAIFLRLQGCVLNCKWCDTTEVWKRGETIEVGKLSSSILHLSTVNGFSDYLVITGGSPLMQMEGLEVLVRNLSNYFDIEIENECVIMPTVGLIGHVKYWDNSPKLSNSGMNKKRRYHPDVIQTMSVLPNSWFKFVVDKEEDWFEIRDDYLRPALIRRDQIILMPQAQIREELLDKQQEVARIALKYGVRYSSREHVVLWDKKTGV